MEKGSKLEMVEVSARSFGTQDSLGGVVLAESGNNIVKLYDVEMRDNMGFLTLSL